ncbi:peptidoglycan DD-metalloendopeptidase family protein [bacterium]|nr:peptidoglycan DD-metalloendopeptidase family protein [bacterium]
MPKSWRFAITMVLMLSMAAAAGLLPGCGNKQQADGEKKERKGTPVPRGKPGFQLPETLEFTDSTTFKPGQSLGDVLNEFEVPSNQVLAVNMLSQHNFDVRRIQVGTDVRVRMADSGLVRLVLELPRSPVRYRVDRTGPLKFQAYTDTIPADTVQVRMNGEISSTLYEAFMEAGGDAEAAMKYIEVFQFVHFFSTETRVGDRFSMIIEKIFREGQDPLYGSILAANYVQGEDTLTAVWRPDPKSERGGEFFDEQGQCLRRSLLRAPFKTSFVLTGSYGMRVHPITGRYRMHRGIDLAAPHGTPVVAAGDGVITRKQYGDPGLGHWLHIKHSGTGFETRYGHFSSFPRGLKVGTRVKQGQVVGFVGSTGHATGPHLHYEAFRDGRRLDPLKLKGSPVEYIRDEKLELFLVENYIPGRVLLENPGVRMWQDTFAGPLPPNRLPEDFDLKAAMVASHQPEQESSSSHF